MNNFEFTFINAVDDQEHYTKILKKIYAEEYGFTIQDNDEIHNGYHSTLVCKDNGVIIGGLSAYISDANHIDRLPMEHKGIHLDEYLELRKAQRYAEICRLGVFKAYRKYHIYTELMKRSLAFCLRIGCQGAIWIAKKYHSEFYKNEMAVVGYEVSTLAIIPYTQNLNGSNPITFDYYLSYCGF